MCHFFCTSTTKPKIDFSNLRFFLIKTSFITQFFAAVSKIMSKKLFGYVFASKMMYKVCRFHQQCFHVPPPCRGARGGMPPPTRSGRLWAPPTVPPLRNPILGSAPPLRDGPRSENFGDLVVGNDAILNKNCFYDVQNPKNFRLRRARVLFLFENR